MMRIRAFLARSWISIGAAIIGYIVGGTVGAGVGAGIGVVVEFGRIVLRPGRVEALRRSSDRLQSVRLHGDRPKAPVILWALVGSWTFLLSYAIFLTLGYVGNSGIAGNLVHAAQPLVDGVAGYVPAFERVQTFFVARGIADRLPVVQHILFVGWATTVPLAVWVAADVLAMNRQMWARICAWLPRRQLVKFSFVALVAVAIAVGVLAFGWGLDGSKLGVARPFGMVAIAMMFVGLQFFFVGGLLFGSALLGDQGSVSPDVARSVTEIMRPRQ